MLPPKSVANLVVKRVISCFVKQLLSAANLVNKDRNENRNRQIHHVIKESEVNLYTLQVLLSLQSLFVFGAKIGLAMHTEVHRGNLQEPSER